MMPHDDDCAGGDDDDDDDDATDDDDDIFCSWIPDILTQDCYAGIEAAMAVLCKYRFHMIWTQLKGFPMLGNG